MDIIRIGKIVKPEGIKGYLRLDIDQRFEEVIKPKCFLFIYCEGLPVPFLMEDVKVEKNFLVKLDDVNNPEDAGKYNNLTIGLHAENMSEKQLEKSIPLFEELVGYHIYDGDVKIGEVMEVQQYPSQMMSMVKKSDGLIIHIPLIDQWIINWDKKDRKILMELPDGLVNMGDVEMS
ncbi:MAG: ribosome maturation factor RimM [Saprospiraceae bacterium]